MSGDNALTSVVASNSPTCGTHAQATSPSPLAPRVYRIGSKSLSKPLVNAADLKAHLSLLCAFRTLRTSVQETPADVLHLGPVAAQLDKDKRWSWFVGLAVERFQKWLETLPPAEYAGAPKSWMEKYMPPMDVLMVWHAYMLNPIWFAEDCARIKLVSRIKLKDRLLYIILSTGDLGTYRASSARMIAWETETATPFDPLAAMATDFRHKLKCPYCTAEILTKFLTHRDDGYLQPNFSIKCKNCARLITKDRLAVAKFVEDMIRNPKDASDESKYGHGVYIAGTVHTRYSTADKTLASNTKKTLQKARHSVFKLPKSDSDTETSKRQHMFDKIKSLQSLHNALIKYLRISNTRRINRIMSAYTDDRPFSLDLAGAVLRQCSFVDKMHDLGWTRPGYFDDQMDVLVLEHAISRYHAFLDLMNVNPAFIVPTLDIDLVWHTHQMMGSIYISDCARYVEYFVDHNDRVEDEFLARSFDWTCIAWKDRFLVPYMYCGCPLPGDALNTSIGQRLTRLVMALTNKDPITARPLYRTDALCATHPSDHNSVQNTTPNWEKLAKIRKKRVAKIEKRKARDAALATEEKIDKETYERGQGHDTAFLCPVPLYYPPTISSSMATLPVGVPVVGGPGGCIVGTSNVWCGTCGSGATALGSAGGAGGGGCGGGAGCGGG